METIYGYELLEQFRLGKKEFSDMHIQFAELCGIDLSELVMKNCKLDFVYFRNSVLKNVKFINCNMFFVSFHGANMENVVMDKCKIEISRLDNMIAKNTKIINSNFSYCLFANTNIGDIDFQNNAEFRVIRNISELDEHDLMEALQRLGMHAETMPFEI